MYLKVLFISLNFVVVLMLVEIGYCADYLLIYFLHLCIQYK